MDDSRQLAASSFSANHIHGFASAKAGVQAKGVLNEVTATLLPQHNLLSCFLFLCSGNRRRSVVLYDQLLSIVIETQDVLRAYIGTGFRRLRHSTGGRYRARRSDLRDMQFVLQPASMAGLWILATLLLFLNTIEPAASAPVAPHGEPTFRAACPNYHTYASTPQYVQTVHAALTVLTMSSPPLSLGPLALPSQRPAPQCRTFYSDAVEKVIEDMNERIKDPDIARLFENAFPNTLDTTISWHINEYGEGLRKTKQLRHQYPLTTFGDWDGPQSFIVTGDITAEWLRDSTNQLQGYQALAPKDKALSSLILGAINTQAEYIIQSPYCNAFQPPPPSGLPVSDNGPEDIVRPTFDVNVVFECKYELDSLAHFLKLGNEYYKYSKSTAFLTKRWYTALTMVTAVLGQQAMGAFNETTGHFVSNEYSFRRHTTSATETLSLMGLGNPLKGDIGLIRSAFRPSDDATILPYFIPANAMMAVELRRTAAILEEAGNEALAAELTEWAKGIETGIREYGIVKHKVYGDVYAFETDGYGSHIMMDDANLPSLLSLPLLGFVEAGDETYQNTRKMILDRKGNPYYLAGKGFSGIGGPHIGLKHAWPMSRLVQAMTSDDDQEIMASIVAVTNSSKLGLVHESVNVQFSSDYTRGWFAWANSVFAQTILDVAARKPHLLFGKGAEPYFV